MRILFFSSFMIVTVCIFCSTSEAENWKKFFTNQAGYEFFYDQDSIVYPNKNNVLVWHKSAPSLAAETKAWIEVDRMG